MTRPAYHCNGALKTTGLKCLSRYHTKTGFDLTDLNVSLSLFVLLFVNNYEQRLIFNNFRWRHSQYWIIVLATLCDSVLPLQLH